MRHALREQGAVTLGGNIIFSDTAPSTQDALIAVADAASDGTVWIAGRQTSGRGRQDRVWVSTKGSLAFSILLRPRLSPDRVSLIMMASAVSLHDAIRKYAGRASIKWPNDILIDGKVAGILLDTAVSTSLQWVVVGVGVNVGVDEKEIVGALRTTPAQGIDSVASHSPGVSGYDILAGFLLNMDKHYTAINDSRTDHILESYRRACSSIGQIVLYEGVRGVAEGVGDDGALHVRTPGGLRRITASC